MASKRFWALRRSWQDEDRGESGVALIEFGFVAPIFILILMGIVQFGAALFIQNNMVNVARDASRRAATGEFTTTQAESFAAGALVNWGMSYNINVSVVGGSNPGEQGILALISVPMEQAAIINFLGLLDGKTLTAHSVSSNAGRRLCGMCQAWHN